MVGPVVRDGFGTSDPWSSSAAFWPDERFGSAPADRTPVVWWRPPRSKALARGGAENCAALAPIVVTLIMHGLDYSSVMCAPTVLTAFVDISRTRGSCRGLIVCQLASLGRGWPARATIRALPCPRPSRSREVSSVHVAGRLVAREVPSVHGACRPVASCIGGLGRLRFSMEDRLLRQHLGCAHVVHVLASCLDGLARFGFGTFDVAHVFVLC